MPVIEFDLGKQRLNAVGDVELVAGGARGDEGDRRAVDGDGVAGREARRQRIRCRGARQQRVAGDRRRTGISWLLTALPAIVADGLKKLSDAAIAEAATSEVSLSFWIDDVSAACRFAVVAAVSTPIGNEPAGGGVVVVAVSSIDSLVPSGRLKLKLDLVAIVRIDGAEIDRRRRRHAGGWVRSRRSATR